MDYRRPPVVITIWQPVLECLVIDGARAEERAEGHEEQKKEQQRRGVAKKTMKEYFSQVEVASANKV